MTVGGRPRVGAVIAIGLGLLALVIATVVGWNAGGLERVVTPPPIIRAFLVGLSVTAGIVLLARSIERMSASGAPASGEPDAPGHAEEPGQPDVPGLIRAVRLAFLAVAAFAAAAGWALAHPLPLVVAAVIAGIDVVETSFLLLVVGRR
jgi:hypothetical protein